MAEHTAGTKLIYEERSRQIYVEGWLPEHDAVHTGGELGRAAAAYAYVSTLSDRLRGYVTGIYSISNDGMLRDIWPKSWDTKWWKPKTPIRDLVRAGALIAAEIDRRLAAGEVP